MKAAVGGATDGELTPAELRFLEKAVCEHRVTEIYTNGIGGVAAQVDYWGAAQSIPVYRVTANFMHERPATVAERNASLVAVARLIIAFPGPAGDDLVAQARKARRRIVESPTRCRADAKQSTGVIRTPVSQAVLGHRRH
jgi:hypothetical protein